MPTETNNANSGGGGYYSEKTHTKKISDFFF